MAVAKVMKMIQDNEVKFVDLRFTDTRGKEQHVSIPARIGGAEAGSKTATRSTAPRSPAGKAFRRPTCC